MAAIHSVLSSVGTSPLKTIERSKKGEKGVNKMKQVTVEKWLLDYGVTYHDAGGWHAIETKPYLFIHAAHTLKAVKGLTDVGRVIAMEETEDKKAWVVSYITWEEECRSC